MDYVEPKEYFTKEMMQALKKGNKKKSASNSVEKKVPPKKIEDNLNYNGKLVSLSNNEIVIQIDVYSE